MSLPKGFDPAAPTEKASEHDGLFSWAGESHAFSIGMGVGLTGEKPLLLAFTGYAVADVKTRYSFTDDPHLRQVVEEPAYAIGGMVLGYLLNLLAVGKPVHRVVVDVLTALGVA